LQAAGSARLYTTIYVFMSMRPQLHAADAALKIGTSFPSCWSSRLLAFGTDALPLPVITRPTESSSFHSTHDFIQVAAQIYRDGFLPANLVPLPVHTFAAQPPSPNRVAKRQRISQANVVRHRFEPKRNRRARVVALADDPRQIEEFVEDHGSPAVKRSRALTGKLGYTVLFTSVFLAGLLIAKKRRTRDWRLISRWALSSLRMNREPRRGMR